MTRLTRAESQARTRAQLLRTARELFLHDGYLATSLDRVADAAGFSKGAVYSNFRNKDELCLAVLDEIRDERAAEIAGLLEARTTDDRLRRFEEWADRVIGDPQWTTLEFEFAVHARRDPALRQELTGRLTAVSQIVAAAVTTLAGDTDGTGSDRGASNGTNRDIDTGDRNRGNGDGDDDGGKDGGGKDGEGTNGAAGNHTAGGSHEGDGDTNGGHNASSGHRGDRDADDGDRGASNGAKNDDDRGDDDRGDRNRGDRDADGGYHGHRDASGGYHGNRDGSGAYDGGRNAGDGGSRGRGGSDRDRSGALPMATDEAAVALLCLGVGLGLFRSIDPGMPVSALVNTVRVLAGLPAASER